MKYILIEAFSTAVILIPAFLLLHKYRFHSSGQTILYAIFAVYLAAVYHLVGLPTVQFLTFDVTLNLIPFVGMIEDLKNSLLNVFLFVPLGFFLPLLWKKYRRIHAMLFFGLGMTMAIECLQLLTYRATDINDIITNFLGTWLGFSLSKLFRKNITPGKNTADLWLILLTVTAVMFFLQPLVASFIIKIT